MESPRMDRKSWRCWSRSCFWWQRGPRPTLRLLAPFPFAGTYCTSPFNDPNDMDHFDHELVCPILRMEEIRQARCGREREFESVYRGAHGRQTCKQGARHRVDALKERGRDVTRPCFSAQRFSRVEETNCNPQTRRARCGTGSGVRQSLFELDPLPSLFSLASSLT